jgi:DNA modification methylase
MSNPDSQAGHAGLAPKRKGPPNRMNDLAYRDWMKYQKSFFWVQSTQALVEEAICFFTKSVWPNGEPSRSLIITSDAFAAGALPAPRLIDTCADANAITPIIDFLQCRVDAQATYDFILVDLRACVPDAQALDEFLGRFAARFFALLRQLLPAKRYCELLVDISPDARSFPVPWSVAMAGRQHLKLRDEKVGLRKASDSVLYCLIMQSDDDARPGAGLEPADIQVAGDAGVHVPAWLLPKSPPRKAHEKLHPAKFPEALIARFIDLFSAEGDNVLDPMAGTGSAIIASLHAQRNGYGVELSAQFVDIANQRIREQALSAPTGAGAGRVVQGDATVLARIDAFAGTAFHYAVTSPPYWSMLTNKGSENQAARRSKNLPLVYSSDDRDLGNVQDYDAFLALLASVYHQVALKLHAGGHLTVIVKNVKREHTLYPLAWDLVARLCRRDGDYEYVGTTLWCQDDIGLKPFAVGIHWVSNILHQYCLHFRKR